MCIGNVPVDAASESAAARARRAELARLLPIDPVLLGDLSLAGRRRLVGLLETALAGERRRGLSGHWTYDLARHTALHWLVMAEVEALAGLAAMACGTGGAGGAQGAVQSGE